MFVQGFGLHQKKREHELREEKARYKKWKGHFWRKERRVKMSKIGHFSKGSHYFDFKSILVDFNRGPGHDHQILPAGQLTFSKLKTI